MEVGVVNLEVVVTDRRGTRIPGLSRGDFELFVDGKPVPIDYFTEVNAGVATMVAGAPAIPGASAGEPVGTSYLVFIDDYFSIAADRNRVLDSLAAQVGLLGPRDRMAVVAWDGSHLTMLSSWTGDRAALARTLGEAAKRPSDGLVRLVERNTFGSDADLLRLASFDVRQAPRGLDLLSLRYVEQVQEQVERATGAVTSTMRAFAMPPGRKVMLLLSGGWPSQPVGWLSASPSLADLLERADASLETVIHTANLLGYTLYPVDVPGMSRDFTGSAEHAQPPPSLPIFLREQDLHYTLDRLADATGGQALLNSRRETALEDVTTDTRSYYWLGFAVDRRFDEKQHPVRVEVRRKGLRLRHRDGFQDFSRAREVTMAVESALLFGSEAAQGPLQVQLGTARRAGFGKVEVPLELSIPADEVTFLPIGDGWTTRLELRLAALDDAGGTADVPVVPLSVSLPQRPEPGTLVPYSTSIRLRKQHHELLVALYDPASGALLSSRLEVDPR
jgi:VWFA-related protein